MRAEHVDAFVTSAFDVLGKTADARPERGSPVLRSGDTLSSRELTALVVLRGDLVGVIFYSMSLATAAKIGGVICKDKSREAAQFDGSAIADLASLICGTGVALLEQQEVHCAPAEPLIVQGFGEPLTGVSPILLVPLFTEYGDIDIGVALEPVEAIAPETQIVAVRATAVRNLTAGPSLPQITTGDDPEEAAGAAENPVEMAEWRAAMKQEIAKEAAAAGEGEATEEEPVAEEEEAA